jgi:cellulose synthase/poly-beta-1,6-N-acetylglucosamine synthase-like glycosyltransferase
MYHQRVESFAKARPRDATRLRPESLSLSLGQRLRSATASFSSGPSELPCEVAFLLDFGVPKIVLQQGVRLARRHGVSADEALLAEGLVDQEIFYRALAETLGLPFLTTAFEIESGADFFACARRGYARLSGDHREMKWVCAPQGSAVGRLIDAARARKTRPGLALTTRANFLDAATRATLTEIARLAPHTVERVSPQSCARRATEGPGFRIALATGALTLAMLFAPYGALALAGALPLAALFAGAVGLRLSACTASLSPDERDVEIADDRLPLYTVIIALYREARVAPQIARAIDRLDYPRAKLEVIFVVEENDEETREVLRRFGPRSPHRILIAPRGQPQTKPRALNIAAAYAQGALVAVFDAEDMPEPKQLKRAAALFARAPKNLACLQASLSIDNGAVNWLTAFFALDYAGLFEVLNKGLVALELPIFLGGTSNHFRIEALRAVGFWDAYNVTEDADLGLRLARAGYTVQTFRSFTCEEAPEDFGALFRQRTRWLKGWMQTALAHCRDPQQLFADLGPQPALATLAMFASGFLAPLIGPPLTLAFLWRAVFGDLLNPQDGFELALATLWCSLALGGVVASLFPILLGMRRAGLKKLAPALFAAPLWRLMLSAAAWRALFELKSQPFLWRKTEHGLARRVEDATF